MNNDHRAVAAILRVLALGFMLAGLWQPSAVQADGEVEPGPDGLPGMERVGFARVPQTGPVVVLGLAHGWTEDNDAGVQGHDQSEAVVAVAYSPASGFALAYRAQGRLDFLADDTGLALQSALTAHYALPTEGPLRFAGRLSLQLPAADSVGRALSGIGGAVAGLVTWQARRVTVGAQLGVTLDRGRAALDDPAGLSAVDRTALEISEAPLLGLGLAAAYRMDSGSLLAELTWEPSVGAKRAALSSAPMWLRLGYRFRPTPAWALSAVLGLSPSQRPVVTDTTRLVRVEPRLWLGLRLAHTFGLEAGTSAPARPVAVPATSTADPAPLNGMVIVANGPPIAGALVRLVRKSAPTPAPDSDEVARALTNEHGGFSVAVPDAAADLALEVSAEGFIPAEVPLTLPSSLAGGPALRTIELTRALPDGQLEGTVRNFKGRPLAAQVRVDGGPPVVTTADGTFALTVAPGPHELRITAKGYLGQTRSVQVEERGVTVLLIDLRRRR